MAKPTPLRTMLSALTNQFVTGVLAAIASGSLEEILGTAEGRPAARVVGRPQISRVSRGHRRTASDIDSTIDAIVALLRSRAEGMRVEEIRAHLGVARKDIHGPMSKALAMRKIRKTGQKRATTYFAR